MKGSQAAALLLAVIATFLFASSCGGKETYEPSTVTVDKDAGEFISIEVKDVNSSGGIFAFENCCDEVLSYGDRNLLEKSIDGEWRGESVEYETSWGALDAGDYRYVVAFTIIGGDSSEPPHTYYTEARFTI